MPALGSPTIPTPRKNLTHKIAPEKAGGAKLTKIENFKYTTENRFPRLDNTAMSSKIAAIKFSSMTEVVTLARNNGKWTIKKKN